MSTAEDHARKHARNIDEEQKAVKNYPILLHLVHAFFKGKVSYSSEYGLDTSLEMGEQINGADLVDSVSCFYQSCKDEGIL